MEDCHETFCLEFVTLVTGLGKNGVRPSLHVWLWLLQFPRHLISLIFSKGSHFHLQISIIISAAQLRNPSSISLLPFPFREFQPVEFRKA